MVQHTVHPPEAHRLSGHESEGGAVSAHDPVGHEVQQHVQVRHQRIRKVHSLDDHEEEKQAIILTIGILTAFALWGIKYSI